MRISRGAIARPIHKDGRWQLLLVGRLPHVPCSLLTSGRPESRLPQARPMRLARRVEARVPCEQAEVQSTVLSTRMDAGSSFRGWY